MDTLSGLADYIPLSHAYKTYRSINSASNSDQSSYFDGNTMPKDLTKENSTAVIVVSLIQTIVLFYALYLSFKCNKGFHLGGFLVACCCSPCYIAYRLAVPCINTIKVQ